MFGTLFGNFIKERFKQFGVQVINDVKIHKITSEDDKVKQVQFIVGSESNGHFINPDMIIIDQNDDSSNI